MKSFPFAIVWQAKPHFASFPCGGLSDELPTLNVLDAASYSNTPHPHPPLSANLLLSFSMNSTSARVSGTVFGLLAEKGAVVISFCFHTIFAILEPSGIGWPFPGTQLTGSCSKAEAANENCRIAGLTPVL